VVLQGNLFKDSETAPIGSGLLIPLRKKALKCKACPLEKTRTRVVFGEGNANTPSVLFLGEAPGQAEDEQGRPFVGKAGQLLIKMVEAMGLQRDEVYLMNVVGCRPPDNRIPDPKEIQACGSICQGQIRAVKPQVIVALGVTAATALLKESRGLSQFRGRWYAWECIPVRVTYHPAYLLRPNAASFKKDAWDDLQAVSARLKGKSDETRSKNGA
jgi:DNA polymerase